MQAQKRSYTFDEILNQIEKNSSENYRKPVFQVQDFGLYHADSLKLLQSIPDNCIDMIFADPPYNLSNDGITCHAGKMVSVNKGDWDRSRGFAEDMEFHEVWITECRRILKPEETIWISGTYHSIYQCGYLLQKLDFHILNDIVWYKPNAAPNLACTTFAHSHETLLWARKEKKAKHTFNYLLMKNGHFPEDKMKLPGKQMRTVWSIPTPTASEKEFGKHPTQKPLALLKRIILASTKEGDIVLDSFNGSGTTGIACKIIGSRKYIGIEMNKDYIDQTIRRYMKVHSQATLKL